MNVNGVLRISCALVLSSIAVVRNVKSSEADGRVTVLVLRNIGDVGDSPSFWRYCVSICWRRCQWLHLNPRVSRSSCFIFYLELPKCKDCTGSNFLHLSSVNRSDTVARYVIWLSALRLHRLRREWNNFVNRG